jgi:hypothetical protein
MDSAVQKGAGGDDNAFGTEAPALKGLDTQYTPFVGC